jgi:hypothetical protein
MTSLWSCVLRPFPSFLGLLLLCALCLGGVMAAAPRVISSAPASDQTIAIAPHRAIYDMGLASTKNGSNISDVNGHMLFEWRDVCDGWAIQQHLQLHFTYNDNEDQDVVSTQLTWEAKDGKSYNFNVRRTTNGKLTESYSGKAVQNADGTVSVTYTVPENKKLELPAGTIFPSAHTQMILQHAAKGEKFFTKRVFDGSDEDGSSDISAFISARHDIKDAALDPKLKDNVLLTQDAWPVHMAFFNPGGETPDYEMDLALMPNGVSQKMKIDYSDFSVSGHLQQVQPLPAQACP